MPAKSRPAPRPEACRVIAFANQKGGVGKTTTCANLAAALAAGSAGAKGVTKGGMTGARVLAVDCDAQGNLTQALGADPDSLEVTLYNVLIERAPLETALLVPIPELPTLSLIGANLELAAADLQIAATVARETRLRTVLEPLLPRFDFILLDCPPALGLLTLNALSAADEVIIPVDAGVFSLRGVAKLMDTIREVRASINPNLTRVRALLSRSDRTNLSGDVRSELERGFGGDLLQTGVRRSVRVGEAQALRIPITLYRPRDPAALDYVALAAEIRGNAAEKEAN